MRFAWSRLLVLFAVLLMPLGMGSGAHATPQASGKMTAAMPHCPEAPRGHAPDIGIATCAMACSAALPAMPQSSEPEVAIMVPTHGIPVDFTDPGEAAPDLDLPPPRFN